MGAIAVNGEFGGEFGFGDESDYGDDDFGDDDFGFGDDFGAAPLVNTDRRHKLLSKLGRS